MCDLTVPTLHAHLIQFARESPIFVCVFIDRAWKARESFPLIYANLVTVLGKEFKVTESRSTVARAFLITILLLYVYMNFTYRH